MARLQRTGVTLSRIGRFGSANSWSRIWLRDLGHHHFQHLGECSLSVLQYPLPGISFTSMLELFIVSHLSLALFSVFFSSFSLYSKSDFFF